MGASSDATTAHEKPAAPDIQGDAGKHVYRGKREEVRAVDEVAFKKGTYRYKCEHGLATVHVPHDVMLSDIWPQLKQMAQAIERSKHEREK